MCFVYVESPPHPTSMLGSDAASAKTETSVSFSTTPPVRSGVNIEFGARGGLIFLQRARYASVFFSRDGKGNACLQICFVRFVDMPILFWGYIIRLEMRGWRGWAACLDNTTRITNLLLKRSTLGTLEQSQRVLLRDRLSQSSLKRRAEWRVQTNFGLGGQGGGGENDSEVLTFMEINTSTLM